MKMNRSIFIAFLVFSLCVVLSTQASLRKPAAAGNRRNVIYRPVFRRNPENFRRKRSDAFGFPPSVLEGLNGGGEVIVVPIGGNPGGLNQGYNGGGIPVGVNGGGVQWPVGVNGGGVGYPVGVNGGGVQWPVGENGGAVVNPGGVNGGVNGGGVVNPGGVNVPYTGDNNGCPFWFQILGLCGSIDYDGDNSKEHNGSKEHDD